MINIEKDSEADCLVVSGGGAGEKKRNKCPRHGTPNVFDNEATMRGCVCGPGRTTVIDYGILLPA